ncbi:MAG: hypothetical protein MUC63_06235 [Planctomycetes bacterium]|jgi:hypothetical protein|nr:hypothetical protein [Planctomycetota bacterium]
MKKFDKIFKKNLETIILEAGLINEEIYQHVQKVQQDSGRPPGDILVEEKYCTETDIARELARNLQLPYLEIDKYTMVKGLFDGFPPELLHRLQVVPIDRFGATVAFAMSQHMTPEGFKELQATVEGGEISFYVALMSKVSDLLDKMIPVDKAKVWESQKKKEEPKPKSASWTDIFDTANKNIVQGMKRDTKITARLDIFDTANRKVIDGLKRGDTLVGIPGAPGTPAGPGAPAGPPAPPKPAPPAPGPGPTQRIVKPGAPPAPPAPPAPGAPAGPPKGSQRIPAPPAKPGEDAKPPEKK